MMKRRISCVVWLICLSLLLAGCGSLGSGAGNDSTEPATFTPDAVYHGPSIEEANQHLVFPLIVPDEPPSPLTLSSVVVHQTILPSSSSLSSSATVKYAVSGATNHFVTMHQTTSSHETPEAEKMQAGSVGSAMPSTTPLPAPSQERHTIAGESILVTTIHMPDGTPHLIYSWELGDRHVHVSGVLVGDLTKASLEQLVAAIIQGDRASSNTDEPGTPTATASPSLTTQPSAVASQPLPTPFRGTYRLLTFAEAQQLTPSHLVMPDPVPPAFEFANASIPLPPAPPQATGTPYAISRWEPRDDSVKCTRRDGLCIQRRGPPNRAVLGFQPASGDSGSVMLEESTLDHSVEGLGDPSSLTIGNAEVAKFVDESRSDSDRTLVVYLWDAHGLHFQLIASMGPSPSFTEQDLEKLIAATLDQQ